MESLRVLSLLSAARGIDDETRLILKQVFYQLNKRYDSSARCVAADILLRNNPTSADLTQMLTHKTTEEIHTYVLQRIQVVETSK